jgi:hypothetical protein
MSGIFPTSDGSESVGRTLFAGRRLPSAEGNAGGRENSAKIDERTISNMNVVLEEVFEGVPHGGDHESRKRVAKRLIQSAKKGKATLDGLRAAGRDTLRQLSARKSA